MPTNNPRPPVAFAGHSDFIAARAGYDMKAVLMPTEAPPSKPAPDLAENSGLGGGVFEVFVPPIEPAVLTRAADGFVADYPERLERTYALDRTLTGIGALLRLRSESGSRVRIVRSIAELDAAREDGVFGVVLHLADADSIDASLETLPVLYEAGVRSLGITWSRANIFGYGAPYRSPGTPDVGPGLSELGIALVRACNELGILVDLAHLNGPGFWDVAQHSTAPLVVSHGAAHALAPDSRALTDLQLSAIADPGGLVGVSAEGVLPSEAGLVADMVAQLTYLLERLGPNGVALGTDLYGRPDADHPGGTSLLPDLLDALERAGWDHDTITKLAWSNWRRIYAATW
jgi:membrane dipeptidase